jgi:hypothetical protein
MTTCPHCSRESDRLAPLLTSRLADVNLLLGLDPHALHEERMARLTVVTGYAARASKALANLGAEDPDPEC